jgi:hypothetical protein
MSGRRRPARPTPRPQPSRTTRSNATGMNAVKLNRGGKLKVSTKTRAVDPPAGFHWMEENGRYFLMKGDYQPHEGAVKQARFRLVSHGDRG